MLINLEASAMADICIRMAREIQKCGQLKKSLLPKGKKSEEFDREGKDRDGRATLGMGKSQFRGKYDLQGHLQMTFTPFIRLKGKPQSSQTDFCHLLIPGS